MFLFLFGFSPDIRHGDRLIVFGSSPRLIPHCLNPCQKEVDTSQVQKRWMRVSLSFWQKVHCSLSFRPILVRKLLVANLLCNSLNWKTVSFVIFVHRKGVFVNCLPIDIFLVFQHALRDPFPLGKKSKLNIFWKRKPFKSQHVVQCNLLFWSSNSFEAEVLNWYSSHYKLTNFWLPILVRKILVLAKKVVPCIFHQTSLFLLPLFPHPGPHTLYPRTLAPHFPPSTHTGKFSCNVN